METKKLAVIILNWNGLELLKQFLPTAVKYTICDSCDLVVADNGSTDDSVKWIRENYPQVIVLPFKENYGFSGGYNRAIAQTSYPFTVLLNSDVEVTQGWWRPLLDFMEKNKDVAAVQPKIRSQRNKEYFEYAGAAGGYIDNLGYPYCRGRLFDKVEKDEGQYDGDPVDVCWASGACLMVRTEVYQRLGGLDEDFFAHQEEIDLCCRMHAAGYRVCALSQSVVYHVGGASLSMGNPRKTYLNFRNNLLLLHKNLPAGKGKRLLFFRRLVDTLAFVMFLAKGDLANARALVKAHRDFRKMRGKYTDLPKEDRLTSLPGADRSALRLRYLPF
ncbi:MAG: glycosyltransferase family 2 protein [Prevotella sp.]|nr:glycosyltransferase family 2 protein [Bacteroides sp.]MCM1366194.1 glycosyltransferase family 2 protein [Prevotella sp.]MCM1436946.1 glycosyltransferase family 2 protein [Prevotella sp.]